MSLRHLSFLATIVIAALSTSAIAADVLYAESYRPQFHFTAQKDWLNDPNGMVFYDGEYHLFFQRTPDSFQSGIKIWGHAISTDMLHWQQLPDAIKPGPQESIWSGSAVVDWNNTAGFQTGSGKVLVAMYTSAGNPFTQCLAYSNDRGRTWTKYDKNPVLPHIHGENRDPKLVWFEPTKKWVVAIYLDHDSDFGLFTSPNLKDWKKIQTVEIPGAAECPDFFPINLDGDPAKPMWVMTGANARYLVGTFDGTVFTSDKTSQVVENGPGCYAVQTFSDIPKSDGRRIQIGWMRDGQYPQMPFNQQMSFPCTLNLVSTPQGPRLIKYPVKEIDALHGPLHQWQDETLKPETDLLKGLTGDGFDIVADIQPGDATKIIFNIRGMPVTYDTKDQSLLCGNRAKLEMVNGQIKLRILIDRTSIEAYGNDGKAAWSTCFLPKPGDQAIHLKCEGGSARVISLKIYEMNSAWESKSNHQSPTQ